MNERAGNPGLPVIASSRTIACIPRRAFSRASAAPVTLKRKHSAATYIAVHNPSLSLDTIWFVERSPGTRKLRRGGEPPPVVSRLNTLDKDA